MDNIGLIIKQLYKQNVNVGLCKISDIISKTQKGWNNMPRIFRIFILTLLALVLLTACSPSATAIPTELPTNTPTPTATPTPTDTATATPTLELWMQSLPENVISVEMDGDHVFGLDAENNRIMQFDLESGKWVVIIDDLYAYITTRTGFYEEKYGMSWDEIVHKKVIENDKYQEKLNRLVKFNEFPHYDFTNYGYVLGVSELPVNNESWQEMGIVKEVVLEVVFPGSHEVGLVLCGVEQNGEFRSFCGPMETEGGNPGLEELKGLYENLFIYANFVDYLAGSSEEMYVGWAELEAGGFEEGSQEDRFYNRTVVRMGENWELWKQLVVDPGGPVINNEEFRREVVDRGKIEKPEWISTRVMMAYHAWVLRQSGYVNPVLTPMWLGQVYW